MQVIICSYGPNCAYLCCDTHTAFYLTHFLQYLKNLRQNFLNQNFRKIIQPNSSLSMTDIQLIQFLSRLMSLILLVKPWRSDYRIMLKMTVGLNSPQSYHNWLFLRIGLLIAPHIHECFLTMHSLIQQALTENLLCTDTALSKAYVQLCVFLLNWKWHHLFWQYTFYNISTT